MRRASTSASTSSVARASTFLSDATELRDRFGEKVFDIVVATGLVEHVKHWQDAFDEMKAVPRARPGMVGGGHPAGVGAARLVPVRLLVVDY
jgi:cyclopropane fatty-acyl-phospholipid synthase-like methyltransferase